MCGCHPRGPVGISCCLSGAALVFLPQAQLGSYFCTSFLQVESPLSVLFSYLVI